MSSTPPQTSTLPSPCSPRRWTARPRAQLLDLLGAEDEETVRTTANAIWRSLYTDSANSKTLLANSLWLSEGQAYKTETVERLANDYYASVFSAPMGTGDTNKAVQAWLNTNTGGLLADAAKNIETKPQTVMLLLSALYFKDRWSDEFYDGATSEDTFTAADGTAQRADFMHKTEDRASYVRGEGYTVAQLSFRGGERMIFLLPDEGTALTPLLRGEAALTDLFTDVYDNDEAQTAKLVWSVPKFDVNSDLELTDALKSLGVTDAFDDTRADFSPLADFDEPAAVTQVQHAARVKIDEERLRGRGVHRHHGERDLGDAGGSAGRGDGAGPPVRLRHHRRGRPAAVRRRGQYDGITSKKDAQKSVLFALRKHSKNRYVPFPRPCGAAGKDAQSFTHRPLRLLVGRCSCVKFFMSGSRPHPNRLSR